MKITSNVCTKLPQHTLTSTTDPIPNAFENQSSSHNNAFYSDS